MSRIANTGATLTLVIALAATALILRPAATETGDLPATSLADLSGDPSTAVVVGRTRSDGFSLLGIEFGETTHVVSVQVSAGRGCFDLMSVGDLWPSFGECVAPVPLAGTVTGGGVVPTGESVVVVDVVVTEGCYRSIGLGDQWPPAGGVCP